MHKFNFTKLILVILPAFFLFVFGTCDHTRLKGEIVMSQPKVQVGDTLYLDLKVPEELENIHGVMWRIQSDSARAIVEYNHLGHDSLKQTSSGLVPTSKADRHAFFVAKEPGVYPLFVAGFFKQTNPQPITDTIIVVE